VGRYIVRRLLASVPVLFMVGVIAFVILHVAPGDPAAIIAGDLATPAEVEAIRRALGMDRPLLVQLGIWIGRLFQGDLGTSVFSGRSVTDLMAPRLEPTIALSVMALLISVSIGIPLGVVAAWKAHTVVDRGVMVFAVLGFSIPVFWLGLNLIWLFSVKIRLLPVLGYQPLAEGVIPFLRHLALPSVTLGITFAALIARMTRSSVLEVLREDYIRTARAKGLAERVVLVRHALKAASLPIVTVIGLVFAALITGVVVTETVFAIPGLGRLVVDAVVRRDFPIIQGMMIVLATAYVLVNLVVDIAYAYLDPRIRY
jgi:peptide/nickel transport system permease protein